MTFRSLLSMPICPNHKNYPYGIHMKIPIYLNNNFIISIMSFGDLTVIVHFLCNVFFQKLKSPNMTFSVTFNDSFTYMLIFGHFLNHNQCEKVQNSILILVLFISQNEVFFEGNLPYMTSWSQLTLES